MEIVGIWLTVIGGISNGSYPAFKNYCKAWKDSHIWSMFSVLTFLIIPLFIILTNYHELFFLPKTAIGVLAVGGLSFSLGMICFTFSLRQVGLGPAFSLNIIISTSLGTLAPLFFFHFSSIFSPYALFIYIGVLCFSISIVLLYLSLASQQDVLKKTKKISGVVLGILSGVLTSIQSSAYNYATNSLNSADLSLIINKLTIWSLFFISSFPLFFLIHFLGSRKQRQLYYQFKTRNLLLTIGMASFYYISIVLFSFSTNYISIPVAWPIFMTSIVLTTNLWSVKLNELHDVKKKYYWAYLVATLLAFIFFSFSMNLGG